MFSHSDSISKWKLLYSFIRGGGLVPDFIVKLNGILKRIVLVKGIIGATQLLHGAADLHAGDLSLALGDWAASDLSSDISFAISTANLRLSLQKSKKHGQT